MVSFFTTFIYGMDKQLSSTTQVFLRQGSIFDEDGKADLIVVGKNQQRMLQQTGVVTARAKYLSEQIVYVKHKEGNYAYKKELKSKILRVTEPKIVRQSHWNEVAAKEDTLVTYICKRRHNENGGLSQVLFFGGEATDEALKDLAICYREILLEGIKTIGVRKIAIPEFSGEFGFSYKEMAAIIVREIVNFVESHPDGYAQIDLFINENSEMDEYSRLLSSAEDAQDKR